MSRDGMVTFMADHLCGNYDAVEKAPGIFTFTTNEALLVDPDNPGNVGFLYQRHDRSMIANIWGLIRKPFNCGSKQLEAAERGRQRQLNVRDPSAPP